MNKRELVELAENIVYQHGNTAIFTRTYTEARQIYDIETSLEIALEQQNLLAHYQNLVHTPNYS